MEPCHPVSLRTMKVWSADYRLEGERPATA